MSRTIRKLVLFKDYCENNNYPFFEFTKPRLLALLEQDLLGNYTPFNYGAAHAFIACVSNATVFGSGFILTADGHCLLHGLTTGNYRNNLEVQLKDCFVNWHGDGNIELEIDHNPPVLDEEAVLLWGSNNFGHWIFTYLHRLMLLFFLPRLRDKKILVWDGTPKRFLAWLARLGIGDEKLVYARDCSLITRLWVPSVLHYRGHYDDTRRNGNASTFPGPGRNGGGW